MRNLRDFQGFTIIELMVASGILFLLASGLFSIMLHFGSSMKKTQQSISIEESMNAIRRLIKEDNNACTETLKGVTAIIDPNVLQNEDEKKRSYLQSIKTAKPNDFVKVSRPIGISANLYLERIFVDDWNPFPNMSTQGTISLNIQYKENKGSKDERTHLKKIKRIWVERLAENKISKCIPAQQSNCYPKRIILGSSARSFDAITKYQPTNDDSQESGTELITIISKDKNHCIGHAVCHDGEWKNLSFCRDSRNNEYWAAELGYTTNWNDVKNFSTGSSVGGTCPAFRAELNCHSKCSTNPIAIPAGYKLGEAYLGSGTGMRPCDPDNSNNSKRYYWKNLECNNYGFWQYDVVACGVEYSESNPPNNNAEIYKNLEGEPIFVSQIKKPNECPAQTLALGNLYTSLSKSKVGEMQLWGVSDRFYTVLCQENGIFKVVSERAADNFWASAATPDLPPNDPYTISQETIDGKTVTVIKKK